MALTDSTTGNVIRDYSIEQLKDAANLMRGYDLVALCAAGSGHAGGTLSVMDITAALYLKVANHDPQNPSWPDRDRIIWSTGHKAPSLYLGLGGRGLLSGGRRDDAAQTGFALPGTSALAQAARRRGLDRFIGPGLEHRRGHGSGRQA